MPITAFTGLPGNGKTANLINEVKERAEKENRAVYYWNVTLTEEGERLLKWKKMEDPKRWHDLPAGAIIIIDECQDIFPTRPIGSEVPDHVRKLAVHRHKGFDLYLVTQDIMNLDPSVRRLVQPHVHFLRQFGTKFASRFEWQQHQTKPDDYFALKKAAKTVTRLPANVFSLYKSAEIHTVKRKLPWMVYAIPLSVVFVGLMIWWATVFFTGMRDKSILPGALQGKQETKGPITGTTTTSAPSSASGHVLTAAEYVSQQAPRIEGLAYTAPAYDDVTKPTRAPYPAACVASSTKCRCYTDDGTRLSVPEALCRQLSDQGFYMTWDQRRPAALEANNRDRQGDQVASAGGAGPVRIGDPPNGQGTADRAPKGASPEPFRMPEEASLRPGGAYRTQDPMPTQPKL